MQLSQQTSTDCQQSEKHALQQKAKSFRELKNSKSVQSLQACQKQPSVES